MVRIALPQNRQLCKTNHIEELTKFTETFEHILTVTNNLSIEILQQETPSN